MVRVFNREDERAVVTRIFRMLDSVGSGQERTPVVLE
jgi:hypothetical protein